MSITRRLAGLTAVACAALLTASAAHAKKTPEQKCQKARYDVAAKYAACQQKAIGKYQGGGEFGKYLKAAGKCTTKYAARWPKLQKKALGTAATCDAERFVDNGDGTVTDNLTGLEWEKKTDDGSVRDKDNLYTWSAGGGGSTEADGTVFTGFLRQLNANPCFAGQCDWRLPTEVELQTLVREPYPCPSGGPCIDATFGPTEGFYYWSSTTDATFPTDVWFVDFDDGGPGSNGKNFSFHARAVRGGL